MKPSLRLLDAHTDLSRRARLLGACRRHLADLNKASDRIQAQSPRGPVAQKQYDKSARLIERISTELKKRG